MQVFCASPWIPVEWIEAHGHEPRGVWFEPSDSAPALPEGVCAFARSMGTMAVSNRDAAFVFTTACDQMRRAADAAFCTDPASTHLFNLPSTWRSNAARSLYRAEFMRLGGFLERLGGRSPAAETLRQAIRDRDEQRAALRALMADGSTREAVHGLVGYYSGAPLKAPHDATGPTTTCDDDESPVGSPSDGTSGEFATGAPRTVRADEARVPLALLGGPLPAAQWSLFETIESCGGRVRLNAIEPGERTLPPPLGDAIHSDDLPTVLANHYFDHIVDVFQRPNSKLYTWLQGRLSARAIRGIVLSVHVGCDLWRAEAESLREAFSIPLLMVESHHVRHLGPREIHRLQAFIESLR